MAKMLPRSVKFLATDGGSIAEELFAGFNDGIEGSDESDASLTSKGSDENNDLSRWSNPQEQEQEIFACVVWKQDPPTLYSEYRYV